MKVSYLILAHNNYLHLERLIDQLNDGNSRIYIHLDKRSELPQKLVSKPNVHFIEQRERIYWGSYSIVRATLNLLERATADDFGDYYCLLSGADFPIKSSEYFYSQLAQGGEYINMIPSHQSKWTERIKYYHFEGINRRNPKSLKTISYWLFEYTLRLFVKKKAPFPVFMGSQWFTLSRACIMHIVGVSASDQRYEQFFKYALSPDECHFHTIIGNSPFAKDVRAYLTYVDWSNKMEPATINKEHVTMLKNTPSFSGIYGTYTPVFARKFNDESGSVIELIKKELY